MTPTIRPTQKQHEAWQVWLDDHTRYPLFGGGAGGGKSWHVCEKRLTRAYQYPGMRSFLGRKELKRLMQSTYVTWTKVCRFHRIPQDDWHLDGKYNVIRFRNGSTIDLLDVAYMPSDPLYERFGSLEYTEGDLEEAGEIQFLAFDVLKSRVGRHMNREFGLLGKLGLTANPSKNWLYTTFYKPWKEGILPEDYAFIQALYQDNPHTAEEYGKQLATIKDKATKERLMFGNWEYDDDPSALISYDAIVDMFTNTVDASSEKFLTADIARYGGDRIVIRLWKGFEVYRTLVYAKQGIDVTAGVIRDLLASEQIPYSHALIDDDGVGGGVTDLLRGVKAFVNGSSPLEPKSKPEDAPKEQYEHLKAQCTYLFADAVNAHRIAIRAEHTVCPPDLTPTKVLDMTIEECEQMKSKDADKDGKRKILPKDEVKEKIGRSPDFSDSLMMRMWFELKPPMSGHVPPPTIGLVKPFPGQVG
jgi:phage terminase large subunit